MQLQRKARSCGDLPGRGLPGATQHGQVERQLNHLGKYPFSCWARSDSRKFPLFSYFPGGPCQGDYLHDTGPGKCGGGLCQRGEARAALHSSHPVRGQEELARSHTHLCVPLPHTYPCLLGTHSSALRQDTAASVGAVGALLFRTADFVLCLSGENLR